MTIARTIAILLTVPAVVMTLLPLLRVKAGFVRILDFPRLQIAFLALAALVALAADAAAGIDALGLGIGAAALATMLFQGTRIAPYSPLLAHPSPRAPGPEPAREVSLLVSNVLAENRDGGRLEALIERCDPDIVLLLETDAGWQQRLAPVARRYPLRIIEPQQNYYGLTFYTRLPAAGAEVRRLVAPDTPSVRAALRTPSGFAFDLYGLHPRPPLPDQSSKERDVELVLVAEEVRRAARPAIVCGDLNDVAWSRTTQRFLQLSGMVDPRVGRGLYSTFHADYWFLRWPLDHVFYSPEFRLVAMEVLPHIGSDHFPIHVRLQAPR